MSLPWKLQKPSVKSSQSWPALRLAEDTRNIIVILREVMATTMVPTILGYTSLPIVIISCCGSITGEISYEKVGSNLNIEVEKY